MKRILALILAVAMLLCLCACGGSGDNANDGVITAKNFKAVAKENNPTVMGTFYRNVTGAEFNNTDPAVKAVNEKADAMLKGIEEYPDTIKAKEGGNTYYISNDGDDKNDGLTPETARATYLSVKGSLKAGDAVLFRRGDLWRGQWSFVSGVSYGAYGEGIKPRFYGSVDASKNGDGEWKETDTEGVYVYSKPISDYCNIIFNNGEALGRPVQKMDKIKDRPYNVVYKSGKVNLYCPEGNPAEVWDLIEIVHEPSVIKGTGNENRDIHVQNLCLMYANFGIASISNLYNFEVEGCIIGYIGGKDLYLGGISIGNGIEMWGIVNGVKLHDNYVFQCYDAALTHQSNSGMKFNAVEQNIYYTKNLVEYSVYSFEAFVSAEHGDNKEYHDRMGYVEISDNISRFAGWGWGYLDRPDKGVPCDIKYRAGDHTEPLVIKNNIFDRPKNGVTIMGSVAPKNLMEFSNNTILQNPKRSIFSMTGAGSLSMQKMSEFNAFVNTHFTVNGENTITEIPNK